MTIDTPGRYSINALLDSAVQPFKQMADEDLEALAKAIGKRSRSRTR